MTSFFRFFLACFLGFAAPAWVGAAAPAPIFVLNSLDADVSIIDPATYTVLRRLPTGKEPHHLYLAPDEKTLIVANAGSNTLTFIDPTDGKLLRTVTGIIDPYHLRFSSDMQWFVTAANRLHHVDIYRWQGATAAEPVNRSINNLEYDMASAIRQITNSFRPRVAFIEGQGELGKLAVQDLTDALSEEYDVSRVRLDGKIDALSERSEGITYRANNFEAAIVAKPDSQFSEKDRFILDQFIMNGGKVLWAVDAMDPHLDSLRTNQFSMATPMDLALDQMACPIDSGFTSQ